MRLTGRVVTSNDPDYNEARTNINTSIPLYPKIIVFCQNTADVVHALEWSKANRMPFRLRSGRHSYENFSLMNGGLIIDVSEMNSIIVNPKEKAAKIEAGAELGDVYQTLWKHGQTIPAGTAANVGLAGLTLGGGIGYSTRLFGLTCDNLLEAEVVLASGEVITANKQHHPDLFWALCGGGGGNFGIVTQLIYRTHRIENVSIFSMEWEWEDFECAYDAWQHWAPCIDDRLTSSIEMKADRTIVAQGQFNGSKRELKQLLHPLVQMCKPYSIKIKHTSFIEAVRFFDDPSENEPAPFKRSGSFVQNPFPKEALSLMRRLLEKAPHENVAIWQQALCGKAGDIHPEDTAFFYRDSIIAQEYNATWAHHNERWQNIRWIESVRKALAPYTTGDYVNWPDLFIQNWQTAYYGDNYPRLQQIKAKYDPDNIFRFPQSIVPNN
ncbi:MAG: FAD-binding oxidoreductase [Bacillus sp. (in: firmicutes)]